MDQTKSNYEVCCGEKSFNDPLKWEYRFLKLAEFVSSWSKDPSTKCGAVIVDQSNRVVSMGFNGFPQHIDDTSERLSDRDVKYALVVHAEVNAMLFANRYLKDCRIFVYPMLPCIRCAVQIVQSGITEVVSIPLTPELEERWGRDVEQTENIFSEADISVVLLPYKQM